MIRDMGGRIVSYDDPRVTTRRKARADVAAMQHPQPPRVSGRLSEQTLFEGEPGFHAWGVGEPCGRRYKGYVCTRDDGHDGPHAAHASIIEQVATWEGR